MTLQTQELIRLYERLPEAERAEVADFARFLLNRNQAATAQDAADQWLIGARGQATIKTSTDDVLAMTRGEP